MAEWAIRDVYLNPVNIWSCLKTWLIHDKKQNKETIKQKNPKQQQQQQNCGGKKMQTPDLIKMIFLLPLFRGKYKEFVNDTFLVVFFQSKIPHNSCLDCRGARHQTHLHHGECGERNFNSFYRCPLPISQRLPYKLHYGNDNSAVVACPSSSQESAEWSATGVCDLSFSWTIFSPRLEAETRLSPITDSICAGQCTLPTSEQSCLNYEGFCTQFWCIV